MCPECVQFQSQKQRNEVERGAFNVASNLTPTKFGQRIVVLDACLTCRNRFSGRFVYVYTFCCRHWARNEGDKVERVAGIEPA